MLAAVPPVTVPAAQVPDSKLIREAVLAAQHVRMKDAAGKTYTVRPGDSLSGIASRACGNSADWTGIWHQNKSEIRDPDIIYPGQVVRFTCEQAAVLTSDVIRSLPSSSPGSGHAVAPAIRSSGDLSGTLSFSGLEQLWEAAGGPDWAASSAAAVAECESGGRQYAYNPSGASGYWQILGEVVPGNVFDPMVNARNAVAKFEASGDTFAQWVCRP
jgi:LysM domain